MCTRGGTSCLVCWRRRRRLARRLLRHLALLFLAGLRHWLVRVSCWRGVLSSLRWERWPARRCALQARMLACALHGAHHGWASPTVVDPLSAFNGLLAACALACLRRRGPPGREARHELTLRVCQGMARTLLAAQELARLDNHLDPRSCAPRRSTATLSCFSRIPSLHRGEARRLSLRRLAALLLFWPLSWKPEGRVEGPRPRSLAAGRGLSDANASGGLPSLSCHRRRPLALLAQREYGICRRS